jgi:DNA modification methylase
MPPRKTKFNPLGIELLPVVKTPRPRQNFLSGKDWIRHSVTVWDDCDFSQEEKKLKHPATFPISLAEKVIACYVNRDIATAILDPFCGSGSCLLAARNAGIMGVGFDVVEEYVLTARQRMEAAGATYGTDFFVHWADATRLFDYVPYNSIDLCFTSPPYWNALAQCNSVLYKRDRAGTDYEFGYENLAREKDYGIFIERLCNIFAEVWRVLKPDAYLVINVMDVRKGPNLYTLHSDIYNDLLLRKETPFTLHDIFIWDRRRQYNQLGPLGFPAVFYGNKCHEYLVVMKKPR